MAHSASGSIAGQSPLAAPSFFFSVLLMILLMASTCPLNCGCAGDAKNMLMLNQEYRCRNREQSNCLPLSDVFPYKMFDFSGCDCCECFGFGPFCEVIDSYDCELKLTLALRHGAYEIESPLRKWPGARHRSEWFGRQL
ncbi:unnamed protein product [Prunus brigantina]